MASEPVRSVVTGRCYCGVTRIAATAQPRAVAYCHCVDCRRVTGAPVAAFAAFEDPQVTLTPGAIREVTANPGVTRGFCKHCGSPLTGRYAYLPGTVYIPLGLLDQADRLAPQLHAHHARRLEWLHIEDDLVRYPRSARDELNEDGA